MSDHHCYACTFSWGYHGFDNPGWKDVGRARLYERCIEAIEAAGAEFSISEVWRTNRDNGNYFRPTEYNMIRHVVSDLAVHGLIVCVHRTPNGKCRKWAKR